jgi:hypothetical protein
MSACLSKERVLRVANQLSGTPSAGLPVEGFDYSLDFIYDFSFYFSFISALASPLVWQPQDKR